MNLVSNYIIVYFLFIYIFWQTDNNLGEFALKVIHSFQVFGFDLRSYPSFLFLTVAMAIQTLMEVAARWMYLYLCLLLGKCDVFL